MILTITHQAARLLGIQDAKRGMRHSDYEGVSFSFCEGFNDCCFEGLGDVLILNPGATVEHDVLETYQAAYLEAWHRAQRPTPRASVRGAFTLPSLPLSPDDERIDAWAKARTDGDNVTRGDGILERSD